MYFGKLRDAGVYRIGIGPAPLGAVALPALVHVWCYRIQVQGVDAIWPLAGAVVQLEAGLVAAHQKPPGDAMGQPLGSVRSLGHEEAVAPVVERNLPQPAPLGSSDDAVPQTHEVERFGFLRNPEVLVLVKAAVQDAVHAASTIVLVGAATGPVAT